MLPYSQADGLPAHFHCHHVLEAGHMLVEEAPDLVAEAVRRNEPPPRRVPSGVAACGCEQPAGHHCRCISPADYVNSC